MASYWSGDDMALRKRKPDPDDAKKALTVEEIQKAHRLGLSVVACRWCNQATFYKTASAPQTCGRLTCGRALKEAWAK